MSPATLEEEVDRTLALYERLTGYPAARTWPMIDRHGYVGALSRLMVSADLQQGFRVLRGSKQLDKTFEAVLVRHQDLFAPEIVQAAQWRLDHAHDLL